MPYEQTFFRPDLRATIYSQNLISNVNNLRKLTPAKTKFCAVVKANAYGHGIIEIVNILKNQQVDFFAVASVYEAAYIQHLVEKQSILIFEPISNAMGAEYIELACEQDFHWAICSLDAAKYAEEIIGTTHNPLNVHVNIETGMGRLGIEPKGAIELINYIDNSPALKLSGVYTHFATADEDDLSFAYEQLENFSRFLDISGLNDRPDVIIHAANSATTIKLPQAHFDMVRCGISMYGYFSRSQRNPEINLLPAMKVEAPIVHIKKIPTGRSVSYGRSYFTKRETLSAIIPSGYSDGYARAYSNCAKVKIGEYFAPVIGRVCMDQVMVDVTDVPNVKIGQLVTIIDNEHNSPAGAYALADVAKTICYEILISVGRHVNRIVI